MLVGLIDIEHMQSVIKVFFFFSKIATILMIWKPSDRETPSFACLQQLSEGVSHNIEEKSLSSVSELQFTCTCRVGLGAFQNEQRQFML